MSLPVDGKKFINSKFALNKPRFSPRFYIKHRLQPPFIQPLHQPTIKTVMIWRKKPHFKNDTEAYDDGKMKTRK